MHFDTYFIHYYMANKSMEFMWTSKLFTVFQYIFTLRDSYFRCWKPENSWVSDAL
jgi:hypothetical protein